MAPFLFQAARAARDLGLFEAVRDQPITPDAAAATTGLPLTSVEVLLDACLAGQLVAELSDGTWQLTTVGDIWLMDAQLQVDAEFTHAICWAGLADLTTALRTGTPAGLRQLGPWRTIYAGLAELPGPLRAIWSAYDHFHSDAAFGAAIGHILQTRPHTVLDVGGNTGRFARLILARDPGLHLTLLDLPGQVAEAAANLAACGDRSTCIALDLLDHARPFPTGMAAVWMSQFLDCFAPPDILALLQRARAALAPGGSLWILEVCPDRQTEAAAATSLRLASLYFTTIANGVSRFYRATTYLALAQQAGLRLVAQHDGLGTAHTLFRFQADDEATS